MESIIGIPGVFVFDKSKPVHSKPVWLRGKGV